MQRQGGRYISFDSVLEHLLVEKQVRGDLFQPGVLLLQVPNPFHLRRYQADILLPPIEVGRLAETCLTAYFRHRNTFVPALKDERFCASENFDAVMNSAPSQPGKSPRKTLTQIGGSWLVHSNDMAFSKLTAHLRNANARTFDQLW